MSEFAFSIETQSLKGGVCNSACQELLINTALYTSAVIGVISLVLIVNLLRQYFKKCPVPELQEHLISNATLF